MPKQIRLDRFGIAMYGTRWKSELSRALGVTYRTVLRWQNRTSEPPSTLHRSLLRIAEKRVADVQRALKELR